MVLVDADYHRAGKVSDTAPMPMALDAAQTHGRGATDGQRGEAQGGVDACSSGDAWRLLQLSCRPWTTGGLAMRAPCVTARRHILARGRVQSYYMPILGRKLSEGPASRRELLLPKVGKALQHIGHRRRNIGHCELSRPIRQAGARSRG